jgi:bacillithiol synthase
MKNVLAWHEVPQLSKADIAYATSDPKLRPFYRYSPDYQSFTQIISDKSTQNFDRNLIAEVIENQYRKLGLVQSLASKIQNPNFFTVVTAHQPTLFLQPLFVILKAITAINLAENLQKQHPEQHFVPIFVLGAEDHDLDELNHATIFGKKLTWQPTETGGSVGDMKTESLAPILAELKTILGTSENAVSIFSTIEKAYSSGWNFAEATQFLLVNLLGKYGLLVLNMDDERLKRKFLPIMERELFEQKSQEIVGKTIEKLQNAGFKTQATPREINLFYRTKERRDRIVRVGDFFEILNTDLKFSEVEMRAELQKSPEKFSPNVVLRPLFQELILPNLAYVGGGGEIAYWLERLEQFNHFGIPFPMLVRRASAVWLDADAQKRIEKFGFSIPEFFQDTDFLTKKFVEKHLAVEIILQEEVASMRLIFNKLAAKAKAIDPTLEAAVAAESSKQTAILEGWENRLRRAEKQKHETTLKQIAVLKEKLFPAGGLQERTDGFLSFYVKYGADFFEKLKENIQPFESGFSILNDFDMEKKYS